MPYVEVWVDEPAMPEDAVKAVEELVRVALRWALRRWPEDAAVDLDRAARNAIRYLPALSGSGDGPTQFPADIAYRKWRDAGRPEPGASRAGAAAGDTPLESPEPAAANPCRGDPR